jgi:hypothetical protein
MERLALVLMISLFALAPACGGGKSGPTTPSGPQLPKVTEGPITKDSLLVFMKERFPTHVADGTLTLDYGSAGVENDVISELQIMGITTTGQLNAATPIDFDTKGFAAIKASDAPTSTVAGLLRDIMIIHNAKLYVDKAWRNGWVASGPGDFPAPAAYGVDLSVLETGGVYSGEGMDPCEGYDPCEGGDDGYDPCAGDPCGD